MYYFKVTFMEAQFNIYNKISLFLNIQFNDLKNDVAG